MDGTCKHDINFMRSVPCFRGCGEKLGSGAVGEVFSEARVGSSHDRIPEFGEGPNIWGCQFKKEFSSRKTPFLRKWHLQNKCFTHHRIALKGIT